MARRIGSKDKVKRAKRDTSGYLKVGALLGSGGLIGAGVNSINTNKVINKAIKDQGLTKEVIKQRRSAMVADSAQYFRKLNPQWNKTINISKATAIGTYRAKQAGLNVTDDQLKQAFNKPAQVADEYKASMRRFGKSNADNRNTLSRGLKEDAISLGKKIRTNRLLGGAAIGALAAGGSYAVYKKLTSSKRKTK
jgi:hypothetical protein